MKNKVALITGASSGIGSELALLLAQDRYNLVLVSRNKQTLATMARNFKAQYDIDVLVVPADLADKASVPMIVNKVRQKGWQVDVLINNAGFGGYGCFDQTKWTSERDMIQVNIVALTQLTKVFLPPMIKKGAGKILNVASVAAFFPGPYMAVYYATKAFVLSLSEALATETAGTGVTVTALCPGPTQTGFAKVAGVESSPLFAKPAISVATVAGAGYEGMLSGQRIVIPGWRNALQVWLTRWLPRSFIARLVLEMQKTKAKYE